MRKVTNKSTKIMLRMGIAVFLAAVLVLSGVGIYFAFTKKDKGAPPSPEVTVNPIDWSVDTWDGESESSSGYVENLYWQAGNCLP